MLKRIPSALLKPSELLSFIRRGESLLVMGEGCCESSLDTGTAGVVTLKSHSVHDITANTVNPVMTSGFYTRIIRLKSELKRAKVLISKLQVCNANIANGIVDQTDIDTLLAEADTLAVDTSESAESVRQVVKSYCYCRLGYHGEMIGCDKCDEWYHWTCINMSQAAAEKTESYICLRCCMHASFTDTCRRVALLTSKWMKPTELAKQRELKRIKVGRWVVCG